MTTIELRPASPYDVTTYGILFRSRYVYNSAHSTYPTRVVVWDNTRRVNGRNGEPVRHGDYGPIDGGIGRYLDPRNKVTDSERSILLSTESIVITNNGTNTGTEASGQVYAPEGAKLRDGDTVTLLYPDGRTEEGAAVFPRWSNGHGHVTTAG